jgi:hypothetical protein
MNQNHYTQINDEPMLPAIINRASASRTSIKKYNHRKKCEVSSHA